jgi:hypothetical protein
MAYPPEINILEFQELSGTEMVVNSAEPIFYREEISCIKISL